MRVQFFGEIADITEKTSEDIILEQSTLSGLVAYLKSKYNLVMEDIHIAVNHELVTEQEKELKESDKIAILSPFAGG